MRKWLSGAAALVASTVLASAAWADDEEIMARYAAYQAAMDKLDYVTAEREVEAAWRGAEESWGSVADTGMLAFNLAVLRLVLDQRAAAVEPAQRVAELVGQGALPSVSPAEATLFLRLAEFDATTTDRRKIRDLTDALEGYSAGDFASTRISWLGWSYAAKAYQAGERWDDSLDAAKRAMDMMDRDATAVPAVKATIGVTAADAAYNADRLAEGLALTHRAVAAYPPQPLDQAVDPMLAALLVWQQGLSQVHFARTQSAYTPDPAVLDPAWDDGRSPSTRGCAAIEWVEQPMPQPQMRGPRPAGVGAFFEYYLEADGSVGRVDYQGAESGQHPFEATLRSWRAKAPEREECRGPWTYVQSTLFPRMQSERRAGIGR